MFLVLVITSRRFGGLIDHIQLKHPLSVTDGPHISLLTSEGLHSSSRIGPTLFFFPCQYRSTVVLRLTTGVLSEKCVIRRFRRCRNVVGGPGSSVGIAADYMLDSPESNPGGDEIFPPVQAGPEAHPASCKMGNGSFPGVKCGRGVLLTTHPLLVLRSWKSRAIPLPTLWTTPGL